MTGVDVVLLAIIALFGLLWLRAANHHEAAGQALLKMGERLNEAEQALSDAQQLLTDTRKSMADWLDVFEAAERFATQPEEPERKVVTKEEFEHLRATCTHCGGSHAVACPRVKRIRFKADGATPEEVEFWADGEWSKDRVVFLEDLTVVD